MSLKSMAEKYFSNLNPIAKRMYSDMNETKLSYDEFWGKLSEEEQNQILSEAIIKPEVSIKYAQNNDKISEQEFALKLIIEDNCSYRDEHSGPFSFLTESQRELFTGKKDKPESKVNKISHRPANILTDDCTTREYDEFDGSIVPKTGLDFLDNW